MNAISWLSRVLGAFHRRRSGQFLVLTAISMVVVLGSAALAVDVGLYLHGRQEIQTAVDAAALAAAQELPDNGDVAEALAQDYMDANDIDIPQDQRDVTFRCIVGDRNGDTQPDAIDIPLVCDPGAGASFTCSGGLCVSPCDFSSPGNKCNTIVVGATKDVPFILAPVLGRLQESTGDIRAAACRGACGGPPTVPLDMVMIIDRTYSMSTTDIDNAKDAARAVLEFLDPSRHHIGLAVLPQSTTANHCQSVANGDMNSPDVGEWVPVGLSDDYQNPDGTLNTSSELVATINCLQRAPMYCFSWHPPPPYPWCPGQTNIGEPLKRAAELLEAEGRPDVKKGIILLTDGQANLPYPDNPCEYAYDQAVTAKGNQIEIFTIGFGIEGARCSDDDSGPYDNVLVTELLADMATESLDDCGNCDTSGEREAENIDGDHFLCEARSEDLAPLFQYAVQTMTVGSRLIQIPD